MINFLELVVVRYCYVLFVNSVIKNKSSKMFSRILAACVLFAMFGSSLSAVCNVNCTPPFLDTSYWQLPDKTSTCDKYKACVDNVLQKCSQSNETALFENSYRKGFKVLDDFCRNPDIDAVKGAELNACTANTPDACLKDVDDAQNDTTRCLALGKGLRCLDDFKDSCKARLLQDFVTAIQTSFDSLKADCKKKGLTLGDNAGSGMYPTFLSVLVSLILVLFGLGNL